MRVCKSSRLVVCAAYHEAGHNVVAARLGLQLKEAGVHIDDGGLGICFYQYCNPEIRLSGNAAVDAPVLRKAEKSIISFYAGLHAQRKFCSSCPEQSASGEEEKANMLLTNISNSGMSRNGEELRQESRQCVADNWKAIQALARQLLQEPWRARLSQCELDESWSNAVREKRLNGQTVCDILKAQGIPPNFEFAD